MSARKRASGRKAPAKSQAKTSTKPPAKSQVAAPAEAPLFRGEQLLETCRTRWQYGEWQALMDLGADEIERDPERATIALLVAAAHSHAGSGDKAREYARRALEWGATGQAAARVLISAAENSLGRLAAALKDDSAQAHFETAVQLVEPRADARLMARTRQVREVVRMGLREEATRLLEADIEALARGSESRGPRLTDLARELALLRHEMSVADKRAPQAPEVLSPAVLDNPRFSRKAYDTYTGQGAEAAHRMIFLDTKSLPRSGLHYLRNTLSNILGTGFSFCEWYTEPGCCRKMPCGLTGFARSGDTLRVRMIKSHDFQHDDPAHPVGGVMQRFILVRDPMFILTSWWCLNMLQMNADLLQEHGISMHKINYLHEKAVVSEAHDVVAKHVRMPRVEVLRKFLDTQVTYLSGFMNKWGGLLEQDGQRMGQLVPYHDVSRAVIGLLHERRDVMERDARERYDRFFEQQATSFTPRNDPLQGPTKKLSQYLQKHEAVFQDAADRLLEADTTGTLRRLGSLPSG